LSGGVRAAAAAGPTLAQALLARQLVRPGVALPLAWAAIFIGTFVVADLVGRIADRLVRALLLGGVNRLAGAFFGSVKGAALLGFALLLAARVLPSPPPERTIARSRLGRPLERIGGSVIWPVREPPSSPGGCRA